MKQLLLVIAGLVAIVAGLAFVKGSQIGALIEAGKNAAMPPQSVSTTEAREQVWTPGLRAVGTVRAQRGVTVSAEVPGLVAKLSFESGARVEAGQVLVQLDASIEKAQLGSAKATASLARATLRRAKGLAAKRINAPADLDTAQAQADQAAAQVANIEAQIAKKTIRAPFAGQLGIRQVDLGQILSAGTPIVSLQDLDTVFVDFYVPQQDLPKVAPEQAVEVRVDSAPDRVWAGRVQSVEPAVDATTRNVLVRAVFDNPDGALHPGMFVEVRVELPAGPPVIVVPATAVVFAPYGNSVYVVQAAEDDAGAGAKGAEADAPAANGPGAEAAEANGSGGEAEAAAANGAAGAAPRLVARQVFVKTGERRGDFVAVLSGLRPGQQVVSAGAFKLRNNVPVVVVPSESLEPQLQPNPKDS